MGQGQEGQITQRRHANTKERVGGVQKTLSRFLKGKHGNDKKLG